MVITYKEMRKNQRLTSFILDEVVSNYVGYIKPVKVKKESDTDQSLLSEYQDVSNEYYRMVDT